MKKSVNKYTTYGKGRVCPNCGLTYWKFLKEFKYKGERFLHFYCAFCMCEDIKHCDFSDIGKILDPYIIQLKGGMTNK